MQLWFFFLSFLSSSLPIPHQFTCRNTPTLAEGTLRRCQAFKWANTMCFFSPPDLINAPIKRKENWLPKGDFARAALIKSGKHEWCASWSDVTAASSPAERRRPHASTSRLLNTVWGGDSGGRYRGTSLLQWPFHTDILKLGKQWVNRVFFCSLDRLCLVLSSRFVATFFKKKKNTSTVFLFAVTAPCTRRTSVRTGSL